MKYLVRVTQAILDKKYPYTKIKGCSIFHALKEAGLPVQQVGGCTWTDKNDNSYYLPIAIVENRVDISKNITGWAHPFMFEVDYVEWL